MRTNVAGDLHFQSQQVCKLLTHMITMSHVKEIMVKKGNQKASQP